MRLREAQNNVTSKFKSESTLAEVLQSNSTLLLMSESELTQLLYSVKSLQKDFQLIPLLNGKTVPAVATAQKLLNIWNDEVRRILVNNRVKDSNNHQLQVWDNEGGQGYPRITN